MSWTLDDLKDGLKLAYEGVAGIGPVLNYEPRSFQSFPLMYTVCANARWLQQGMGGASRKPIYELTSTLVFQWQDTEQAEISMDSYVELVSAAVHADMTLGGKLDGGANCIVDRCERIYVETGAEVRTDGVSLTFPALQFTIRAGTMEDIA